MVGVGVVSLDQAYRAIDFDAITLLLGMMIVVANLRLSGFFRLVSNFVVARACHPLVLLMAIVLVAGSFSAFLVNDTICLVLTPLVLDLVRFTELAQRKGERGLLTFLSSFFKSPHGVTEHDFVRQFQMLQAWASGAGR